MATLGLGACCSGCLQDLGRRVSVKTSTQEVGKTSRAQKCNLALAGSRKQLCIGSSPGPWRVAQLVGVWSCNRSSWV